MPYTKAEIDQNQPFTDRELLYRRAFPNEINSQGELDPTQIQALSYGKEEEGAPSVLRGAHSQPVDALMPVCAGDKEVPDCSVYAMEVREIPGPLKSGTDQSYSFRPVQKALELCGAHSVLSCYLTDDPNKRYEKPPDKVRREFRAKLAIALSRRGRVLAGPRARLL